MKHYETIDAAIVAHQTWVIRFRKSMSGSDTAAFDLNTVADDGACVLGQWLKAAESKDVLGQDMHKQIMALHATFHAVASDIAKRLNYREVEADADTKTWIAEFNNLSDQLIMLLTLNKNRM